MPSPIRRELVKGKLQPPSQPPLRKSYTVTPTSINEVTVRHPSDKRVIRTYPRIQVPELDLISSPYAVHGYIDVFFRRSHRILIRCHGSAICKPHGYRRPQTQQ